MEKVTVFFVVFRPGGRSGIFTTDKKNPPTGTVGGLMVPLCTRD
jgi:hypothetical protein